MVKTTKGQEKDLPSATAPVDSGRRTTQTSGSRNKKPTEARKIQLEEEHLATEESVEAVTETLEQVLINAKLPEKAEKINMDTMEDHCCTAMDSLSVKRVNNMYSRYQEQWKLFVSKKKVKEEYDDKKLLEFFKQIRNKYAPSTLWVIYSCLNSYFIDSFGKDLKQLPRLSKYLKRETHLYVAKQSKVFKPEEIHKVLLHCQQSSSPKDTLMGVIISLMYYGLLRCTDVLRINVQDVSIDRGGKVIVKFDHTRKRVNFGFTFWVPHLYAPLYKKYFCELERSNAKRNTRFLKNYNSKAGTRTKQTGKNMVTKSIHHMCLILGISDSEGYTTHCFRRSAATNLADAGVSLVNLKRHGQWKSDSTAERYIANSVPIRKERLEKLLPAHLRKSYTMPPSLATQYSTSSSESSVDSPVQNLVQRASYPSRPAGQVLRATRLNMEATPPPVVHAARARVYNTPPARPVVHAARAPVFNTPPTPPAMLHERPPSHVNWRGFETLLETPARPIQNPYLKKPCMKVAKVTKVANPYKKIANPYKKAKKLMNRFQKPKGKTVICLDCSDEEDGTELVVSDDDQTEKVPGGFCQKGKATFNNCTFVMKDGEE